MTAPSPRRQFMVILASIIMKGKHVANQILLHCGHVAVLPREGKRPPPRTVPCDDCAQGNDAGWRALSFPAVSGKGRYIDNGKLPIWGNKENERFEGWIPPRKERSPGVTDEAAGEDGEFLAESTADFFKEEAKAKQRR